MNKAYTTEDILPEFSPQIRTIVCRGLYWGPCIWGNYHVEPSCLTKRKRLHQQQPQTPAACCRLSNPNMIPKLSARTNRNGSRRSRGMPMMTSRNLTMPEKRRSSGFQGSGLARLRLYRFKFKVESRLMERGLKFAGLGKILQHLPIRFSSFVRSSVARNDLGWRP